MRNIMKIIILLILVSLSSCSILHKRDKYYVDEDNSKWYETDGVLSVSDYFILKDTSSNIKLKVSNLNGQSISFGPPYLPIFPLFISDYPRKDLVGLLYNNIDSQIDSTDLVNMTILFDGEVRDVTVSAYFKSELFRITLSDFELDFDSIEVDLNLDSTIQMKIPKIILYRTKRFYHNFNY
jgi:hypothetical protein